MKKTVIVALGGNLFVSDETHQSVPDPVSYTHLTLPTIYSV